MTNLTVDIWSDIACPWCYVGKRRFDKALQAFEHGDAVTVVWRAFELDPSAPPVLDSDLSYAERLARKYRVGVADAEAMIERMTAVAAEDGLDFRFDRIRPGNTFDAHRLLHLALERGRQDELKERLLAAYLTEGAAIGDRDTLARLAPEAGLDEAEVARVLASDQFATEVREDEAVARVMRVTGVPFFRFAGRFGVSGAQSAEALALVLGQVWDHAAREPDNTGETAVACSLDGCD